MSSIKLPGSYTEHMFTHISLSHHPSSSQTVTPVIVITLDRIEKSNAFTSEMEHSLVEAFDLLDIDDRVKVIVVTGKGRMFCAGADLDIGFNRNNTRDKDNRDGGGRVSLAINRCRKPTIAAIQGPAVGVGITMTLPMTIRIAYEKAKIGFVFGQRGLIMEACSSFFLPRLVGHSKALYLTTTAALELATQIVSKTSPISTYLMRELMYRGPSSAEGTHLLDSLLMVQLYDKEDKQEGVNSFIEKRPANFRGNFDTGLPPVVPWWEPVNVVPPRIEARTGKSKL
ncbi:enoyl-CoA hydratase [Calycina marina]|uniref:Enoyl-CoA hydratase n=1 Tax=Calycina marina TaxID=1763456 RepID=A0A9P7Z3M4_9HELO|nr:enoyl-CoA hydratase [Calycina marina]